MELDILLSMLTAKDTKRGYGAFLELEHLSEESDDLYPYTERFADMVSDRAWAVRCRGFRLFCKQARWDGDGVIDRCLDRALAILEDEKPTAVRQALAGSALKPGEYAFYAIMGSGPALRAEPL